MPTKSKQNTLTTKDIMLMFCVDVMTVYNWRNGSARITPLPHHLKPHGTKRHRIFFKLHVVKRWAAENNQTIILPVKSTSGKNVVPKK